MTALARVKTGRESDGRPSRKQPRMLSIWALNGEGTGAACLLDDSSRLGLRLAARTLPVEGEIPDELGCLARDFFEDLLSSLLGDVMT